MVDGFFSVEPASLDGLAGQLANVASNMSSVRGSLAGDGSGAAGCAGLAAASFDELLGYLTGAALTLEFGTQALSRDVAGAAASYVSTDDAQMGGAGGTASGL